MAGSASLPRAARSLLFRAQNQARRLACGIETRGRRPLPRSDISLALCASLGTEGDPALDLEHPRVHGTAWTAGGCRPASPCWAASAVSSGFCQTPSHCTDPPGSGLCAALSSTLVWPSAAHWETSRSDMTPGFPTLVQARYSRGQWCPKGTALVLPVAVLGCQPRAPRDAGAPCSSPALSPPCPCLVHHASGFTRPNRCRALAPVAASAGQARSGPVCSSPHLACPGLACWSVALP